MVENNSAMVAICNSYLEIIPNLYKHVEKEIVIRTGCQGSVGPKKQKLDCSGQAAILLEFEEAEKHEGINLKMSQNQDEFSVLIEKLKRPPPERVILAIAFIEKFTM